MVAPEEIQLIGDQVAIRWSDGLESFFSGPYLRAHSPSAENQGETDIFGVRHGGSNRTDYSGVGVTGWERVGNYAIRFDFSDGHNTGLFTYDYLRSLQEN